MGTSTMGPSTGWRCAGASCAAAVVLGWILLQVLLLLPPLCALQAGRAVQDKGEGGYGGAVLRSGCVDSQPL